ncbi:MAG: tRNA pseudouridine(38-40) synthase TruA [Oscillospiraceae bacterium]|nr:tRNA pseudouridine(38-40) synthase TruA [Oscillospiraceae bacterium]
MVTKNIALRLMYVGTDFHGWQVQKNAVTVAETLERAISGAVNHPVRVVGCGRTDAGVHARVYIANFRTNSKIPLDRLPLAINARLPHSIVVTKATEVPADFNAIGSCLQKEYTYLIYNSRLRNAFYVNRAYFYPQHLDEQRMMQAAAHFVGTHDFAAVRSVGTDVRSTVRTIRYCNVQRTEDLISISICADGFLYNMVRAITGTLVYVGIGKLDPDDIPALLEGRDRTAAGPTLPPDGLYLTRLWYHEDIGVQTAEAIPIVPTL